MSGILYFILTILLLDVLVIVHEGGHFLCARAAGVKIHEFSVGMGPVLLSRTSKKDGIQYSLRAFPIGGFVAMEGEDGDSSNPDAFCNKGFWPRLVTLAAGACVNILIGFLCMFVLVCASTPVSTVIAEFDEDAVSCAEGGLCVGDEIIKVGKTRVFSGSEAVYEILYKGYEPIDITVKRNGEKILLEDVQFRTEEESGVKYGVYDFTLYAEEKNLINILAQTATRCLSTVKMILDSLKDLCSGRYGFESVSGPIGISGTVGEAAKAGWRSLLYLFAIIAVNLGIMNLLPLPALDGGRILILIVELIIGHRVNKRFETALNGVGFVLLMALMIAITGKDLFSVVSKYFGK